MKCDPVCDYRFFLHKYENTELCPKDKSCKISPLERVCVENNLWALEKEKSNCQRQENFTPIRVYNRNVTKNIKN